MFSLVIFSLALFISILMIGIKVWELSVDRKSSLSMFLMKGDKYVVSFFKRTRLYWSYVNFHNTHWLFFKIVNGIRDRVVNLKRKFDHEQSHFFVKKDHDPLRHKHGASFFLKDISAHKKTILENNDGPKEIN